MEITESFVSDLTTNLQVVANRSYEARNKNLWWTRVASQRRSQSRRQILAWLLDQWKLRIETTDGNVEFEDAYTRQTEVVHSFEKDGIELFESEFEDLDGAGVDIATAFVRKMGSEFAYSPQRQLADMIKANPNGYDGLAFFHATHPVSGKQGDTSMGTYSNLLTGAGVAIDDATVASIDTAKKNLGASIAKARAIKAPDGSPRGLVPIGLLVPGKMATRAVDLLAARFIGAAGSTDHTQVVSAWNLGQPLIADELGADYGGSDSAYYLIMVDPTVDDLGGFVWSVRKDYRIKYPTLKDALYQESNKLRWVADGRTGLVPGHPFAVVKCAGGA